MTLEAHRHALGEAGKLKLRATAILAEGDDLESRFRAAVLLHDAARAEARAMRAVAAPSDQERLGSLVEQCMCFVEGCDPLGAARLRGQILEYRDRVDRTTFERMSGRLKPAYDQLARRWASAIRGSRSLLAHRVLVPSDPEARDAVGAEIEGLADRFPGTAELWWGVHRHYEAIGDWKAAWEAIERARQLQPDNHRYLEFAVLLAARRRPVEEARRFLAGTFEQLDRLPSAVSLFVALGELELAGRRRAAAHEHWRAGLKAVHAGLSKPQDQEVARLHQYLEATRLLLVALLAGEKPTMDLLYQAGLGDLVIATTSRQKPQDVLRAALSTADPGQDWLRAA